MKRQSMKRSIFIMTCANMFNKVMGAGYNIALIYLLTAKGVGLLNNAINIYTTLVVLFTSGFSTALAKLIAENAASGRHRYAHRLFKISFYIFGVIGIVAGYLMYEAATYLAVDSDVNLSIIALIPAILFVSLTTIFRGYFQGMRYMTPISLAQTGDQITKILIGSLLVIHYMPNLRLASFGAALGFTAGAFVSLSIFVLAYLKNREKILGNFANVEDISPALIKDRELAATMLKYVIPVSLCGFMIQTIGVVDQFMINKILPAAGYNVEQAKLFYGILTGQVSKLIDIPSVITIAVAANMMPTIAADFKRGMKEQIRNKATKAYSLAMLIAAPAAFGLAFLGQPILELIYQSQSHDIGGAMLSVLAYSTVFIALIQVNNSVLQGMDKLYVPVRAAFFGFAAKITVSLGIFFYPDRVIPIITIGTLCFYSVTAGISFVSVTKAAGIDTRSLMKQFMKIVIVSLAMALTAVFTYNKLIVTGTSESLATVTAVIAGVIAYGIYSFIISRDIIYSILGGK